MNFDSNFKHASSLSSHNNVNKGILDMPNLLLIAGDGRNVGKTFLACSIIKQLSGKHEVIGLKISPHFHSEYDESEVLIKTKDFIILKEKSFSNKDSSLMLQAGAKNVFFIMAKQENIFNAFKEIQAEFSNFPVVCESGGLIEFVTPGLFLFVSRNPEEIEKKHLLKYNPLIINNQSNSFDFKLDSLDYDNNRISVN